MFVGDTGEGLLCRCTQTLELPPTRGQAGPIFAVLPQAGKDLSLQESLPLVTSYLCVIFRYIIMHYCFEWTFTTICAFHFSEHFWHFKYIFVNLLLLALILPFNYVRCLFIFIVLSFKYCLLMLLTAIVYSLFSTLHIIFQYSKPLWILFKEKGGLKIF